MYVLHVMHPKYCIDTRHQTILKGRPQSAVCREGVCNLPHFFVERVPEVCAIFADRHVHADEKPLTTNFWEQFITLTAGGTITSFACY